MSKKASKPAGSLIVTPAAIQKRLAYLEMAARVGNASDSLERARKFAGELKDDSNAQAFLVLADKIKQEAEVWKAIFNAFCAGDQNR